MLRKTQPALRESRRNNSPENSAGGAKPRSEGSTWEGVLNLEADKGVEGRDKDNMGQKTGEVT